MNHLEGRLRDVSSDYQSLSPLQHQFVSTILLLGLGYYVLSYFDNWPSTIKRFLYETSIRATPSHFIYGLQHLMMRAGLSAQADALFKREHFGNFARKEEAISRLLRHSAFPSVLKKARTISRYDRLMPSVPESGPPGLGNWDNSCYQNSILQGLASLPAFHHYIYRSLQLCQKSDIKGETTRALSTFLDQLADANCPRTTMWTPAVLKSMDSWQQQDAQEYFSRVTDAIEKEALQYTRILLKNAGPGLPRLSTKVPCMEQRAITFLPAFDPARSFLQTLVSNPMDGLQAQALECQTCKYSEGISLTQFNCLTLSLGVQGSCHLTQLLDEYTEPELIEGVECDECTRRASSTGNGDGTTNALDDAQAGAKPAKQMKLLRTKAKQLTLGRLPRDFVFHINRSIFDEYGNQRKNASFVQFDTLLEIPGKWCAPIDADEEKIQAIYRLQCIITHSGRHDNGHYVAYGRRDKDWYCFNDEIVTKLTEQDVLNRGNVFMLFYEATEMENDLYVDAQEMSSTISMTTDDLTIERRLSSATDVAEFSRSLPENGITITNASGSEWCGTDNLLESSRLHTSSISHQLDALPNG